VASTRNSAVVVALAIALQGGTSPIRAQEAGGPILTNLQMFQSLATRIGDQAASAVSTGGVGSLAVVVSPGETAWTIEQEIIRAFRAKGFNLLGSPGDSAVVAEFGIADARVSYSNIRRDGLFGQRVLDREVRLTLRGKIVDRRTGSLLLMKEWTEEREDGIGLSQIESLESYGLPMTKGVVPPEGFFSGLVEPLVLLGAIGVAVLLLFSVRS